MPTAEPFTFVGSIQTDSDNNVTGGVFFQGLPFCLRKFDITTFDTEEQESFITLGGYRVGGSTEVNKGAEIVALNKLFWNLYSVNGFIQGYDSSATPTTETAPELIIGNKPNERTCHINGIASATQSDLYFGLLDISSPVLQAIYNGPTDEESNFIGFGLIGLSSGLYCSAGPSALVILRMRSYSTEPSFSRPLQDSAYVNFDGIHFLVEIFYSNFGDTSSANAATLSCNWSRTVGGRTISGEIDLLRYGDSPFVFYTYED